MANSFLNLTGLTHLVDKIKELIPTKTSELDNDSDFITSDDVPQNTLQLTPTQTSYDANTCYDGKVWLIQYGSNCPTKASDNKEYGALFTLPYRKATGNSKPDFAGQIFIPNGDDTKPNSLFYRTSLRDSWNPWQEVTRGGFTLVTLTQSEYNALSTKDSNTLYFIKG